MKSVLVVGLLIISFFVIEDSVAQEKMVVPDLSKVTTGNEWQLFNRKANISNEGNLLFVNLNSQPGEGIVWIKGREFGDCVIEADVRGKDEQGKSFVGIAFNGVDSLTYDAIYFRPFNFKSEDPARKAHSVQYISHPTYTWSKLRQEQPQKFENIVEPVPDPNSFFHVKIDITKPTIKVYVNNSDQPCLSVDELSNREKGWVGFWVGNFSEGSFTKLKIVKKN